MAESGGFEVNLAEARKAADVHLPAAAEHIRQPLGSLTAHEPMGGAGDAQVGAPVGHAYVSSVETLARHIGRAAEATDGIAEALRDILDLYRRADGRLP